MIIWGGALAPRGIDRPGTGRDTHSPTTFIRDLGAAYRASGRERASSRRVRVPPLPGELEHLPDQADRPELEVDRPRGLRREAPAAARRGLRARSTRPLQRARRRDGHPARKGLALRGQGGRQAGRRGDPGRVLPGRDPRRLVPEERGGAPPLPLARRAQPRQVFSPASTTRTARRRRASSPCARRSRRPGRAASSRTMCA